MWEHLEDLTLKVSVYPKGDNAETAIDILVYPGTSRFLTTMCAKNHFSVTLFGIDPKLLVEMLLNEIERLESDKIDQLADRKALEKTLGVIKNSEVGYTSAQEDQDRAQYYEQKYEAS